MSSRKAPEGPFPYPTTAEWAENLYEAIANTCAAEGFAPAPRPAVIEGLAPALGRGEAKRVIERRRDGGRFLRPTAFHVEQRDTDGALLLLNVALHGAATLPWVNNDRTRSDWLHPRPPTRPVWRNSSAGSGRWPVGPSRWSVRRRHSGGWPRPRRRRRRTPRWTR